MNTKSIIGVLCGVIVLGGAIWYSQTRPEPIDDTSFKNNFIIGCTEDGDATYTQCSCMYDKIKKDEGIEWLFAESTRYELTNKFSDGFYTVAVDAALACYK